MSENLEKFKGTPCLNCGRILEGKYCRDCGQRATDVKQTMWGLLTEYLEHGLSLDSNFARTIISLVSRPGRLTVDYLEGRRARYFSPVRLYLLMSLCFFWSLTIVPDMGLDIDLDDDQAVEEVDLGQRIEEALAESGLDVEIETTGSGIVQFSRTPTVATGDSLSGTAAADSTAASFWERVGRRLESSGEKAAEDPVAFTRRLFSNMSKAMFLLVPVFALLLRILNFRRRMAYLPYMVFALNIHAVYFLIATIFNIISRIFTVLKDPLQGIMIFFFPVYIIVAMRTAFGGTWIRSWLKVALLVPAYGLCLGLGLVTLALVQLIWMA